MGVAQCPREVLPGWVVAVLIRMWVFIYVKIRDFVVVFSGICLS